MEALTVADIRNRLADAPDDAVLCACGDKTHAACDIVTDVYYDDGSSVVSLFVRHPSNVDDEYPFREEIIAELINAAKQMNGVEEWRSDVPVVETREDVKVLAGILDRLDHDPYSIVYYGPQS